MSLRPYQATALERARAAVLAGQRRILLTMPCGGGKGHLAAALVASSVAKAKRVLFVVHRRELVLDLALRIRRNGIDAGVILPGEPSRPYLPAQVASIQTLSRRTIPEADLVITDECHHASSASWRAILDAYPQAVIVGFSATPCRMSGAPLGDVFETLIQVTTPAELVELGFLVPMRGWSFAPPDLSKLPRSRGDFDSSALELVMSSSRVLGDVVGEYQRHAAGTQAICFAVNVEHSLKLTASFQAAGVAAEHLDGTASRSDREAAFRRFSTGATRVLCNVGLFTEGVDLPCIETVILARPTASLSLYLQMLGRGRRPLPCACGAIPHWRDERCACGLPVSKRFARLHDHAGAAFLHGGPDEPRVWTLDKPVRVTTAQLRKGLGSLRTCTSCFALYAADLAACPMCNRVNRTVKRLVRNGDGVAVPLDEVKKRDDIEPGPFLRWLQIEARRKHYDLRWIAIRFKARFHRWPSAADRAAASKPQSS